MEVFFGKIGRRAEGRGGVGVPACWRAGCVILSLFSGGSTERILVVLIVTI